MMLLIATGAVLRRQSRFAGINLQDLAMSVPSSCSLLILPPFVLLRRHRNRDHPFVSSTMFENHRHNVRLYFVISLSICLRIGAVAAPAPARNEAGISFTPFEDAADDLIHSSTADPSTDAQSVMQDLHASYVAITSTSLNDGCTEDNMIVRKEWYSTPSHAVLLANADSRTIGAT